MRCCAYIKGCIVNMHEPVLHLISLGMHADAQLDSAAITALKQSNYVIGSARQWASLAHLGLLQHNPALQFYPLPAPLSDLPPLLASITAQNISLLASGDGLFYGLGQWLTQQYPAAKKQFYPNVSSIQTACHRLGLPWQDMTVVSCHGRPLATLIPRLRRHRYFALFTDAQSQPKAVATLLATLGFDASTMWVCERLGYPDECIQHFSVDALRQTQKIFDPLHVTLFQCEGVGSPITPEFPGIADDAFATDGEAGKGLLTKQAIRLHILAALQPTTGDIGWDIGAGCGGVTVEWARYNRFGELIAIEQNDQRVDLLRQNIARFGVMRNVTVQHANVLDCWSRLPPPNKVFIGGHGGQLSAILHQAWQHLLPGGTLVVSAVTEASKLHCLQFIQAKHLEDHQWLEIALKKRESLAGQLFMRPALPVTLITLYKALDLPSPKQANTGTLIGVGLGPGDPELLTLKADKTIRQADVVAYLENQAQVSLAKQIALPSLRQNPQAIHLPIPMHYDKDRQLANQAYDTAAETIASYLDRGQKVAFLCEGDPLFYGSFMYLLARLGADYPCQVVAGISAVQAVSAQTLQPLCQLQENLAVLNGRNSDAQIQAALCQFDHLVILKVGRQRPRLLALIASCERTQDTLYSEYLTCEQEKIVRDVSTLSGPAPYFSLLLVSRKPDQAA